jgi:hypothetical protein
MFILVVVMRLIFSAEGLCVSNIISEVVVSVRLGWLVYGY